MAKNKLQKKKRNIMNYLDLILYLLMEFDMSLKNSKLHLLNKHDEKDLIKTLSG